MSKRMTAEKWHAVIESGYGPENIKEILWDWQNDRVELQATADQRLGLLREIKEMVGYCPYCWANFKEPCADGCKMDKELGDE